MRSLICPAVIYLLLIGEFGVVYRATLGLHGRSGLEVAVKTLKGLSKCLFGVKEEGGCSCR